MKYKVGDVTVWYNGDYTQYYEVTDIEHDSYKLKITFDSRDDDLTYHEWNGIQWVDNHSLCRLLTPLDKLI